MAAAATRAVRSALPRLPDGRDPRRPPRCPACGSPAAARAIPELDALAIAHVDCDAFYAGDREARRSVACATSRVIIGGGKRGVVSTCCYIARIFGVRSAMPMFKALAALPGRGGRSSRTWPNTSRSAAQVRALMLDADAAGRAAVDRRGLPRPLRHRAPARHARRPSRSPGSPAGSRREIGITVSVGLSPQQVPRQDRLRSRQAARLRGDRRADGAHGLPGADGRSTAIWGVGKAFAGDAAPRTASASIGDLQARRPDRPDAPLRRHGRCGSARLAAGDDDRAVDPNREAQERRAPRPRSTPTSPTTRPCARSCGDCRRRWRRGLKAEGSPADRDAEAEDGRFPPRTRGRRLVRPDPARRPHLPRRRGAARARTGRDALPAGRRAAVGPLPPTRQPTRPTSSTPRRGRKAPPPSARWTRCARSSDAPRWKRAWCSTTGCRRGR